MSRPRLAILISGRGSNLRALMAASSSFHGDVACVISSRGDAPGLEIAREHGVATHVLTAEDRVGRDAQLMERLRGHGVDTVALAGFMRIVGDDVLAAFTGRIVNVHPSLLPSFAGLHPHRQALAAGVRVSGCTVHFVEPGAVDGGAVVAQAVVPVRPGDDEAALAARILAAEHRLYPRAVAALLRGGVRLVEGRAQLDAEALEAFEQVSGVVC